MLHHLKILEMYTVPSVTIAVSVVRRIFRQMSDLEKPVGY